MEATIKKQRLIGMEISNFLKVTLLTLKFDENENLIIIAGNNGEGKTSALNAVESALAGGHSIPAEPLTKGKAKGYTILETTDYIIKRFYTKTGTSLVVEAKKGGKISSPQKLLNSLVGSISFDPLAFSNMKAKEQLATLQELLGLDFSELDEKRATAYEERRYFNRELKAEESRLDGIESFPDVPKKIQSASSILKNLDEARLFDEALTLKYQELQSCEDDISGTKTDIQDFQNEIQSNQKSIDKLKQYGKRIVKNQKTLADECKQMESEKPDARAMQSELDNIEETNEKVRSNIRRSELRVIVDTAQRMIDEKQTTIDALDEEKQKQLSETKMPVKGLSFDETGVRFNDIPFENCSQAEKLRVSTAMAMAENPKLALMLIRDGSLLDDKSMKLMYDLAQEYDCQVLLEYAGNHKDAKVVLENGEAKSDD